MQKKNREGFTLIELLAVIVILAIIALIAVPVIMNVITKARVSAFEDSAYGIVKAGEMYYTNKLLDTEGMTKSVPFTIENGVFTSTEKLDVSGSLPKSGKITVTSEGKVALAISNGEYCIRKATTESKVKAEKLSDIGNNCDYKTEEVTPNPVFEAATGETSIPACIADNTECTAEAIKDGLKVGVKVNDSETKDFYVIKDESNELTLIMDQNLGNPVAWASEEEYGCTGNYCSLNDKGPITALKALEERTSNWTNIPETTYELVDDNDMPRYEKMIITDARARLLTNAEAKELGCTNSSGSCPIWLYGNLDQPPYGYWTSATSSSSNHAEVVNYNGRIYIGTVFFNYDTVYDYGNGIRPVITISKTTL